MSDKTGRSSTTYGRTAPEVPGFDLIRPIGKGGFGEVWMAANQTTRQLRAVKVISTARSGTVDAAGREITSIICLEANLRRHHANLVTVHHVGQSAGHIFFVMDLADDVTGEAGSTNSTYQPATLQSRLQTGPLAPDECWRRTGELLAGLAALHDSGMVHRDVKPANCLFVGGELKLADFGLLTEADGQMSRVGTLSYMPPDGHMDERADVYAAGLTIYEMVTGLPPSCFPSLGEHAAKFADDPRLLKLNRLVLRACHSDPNTRFANAQEMLNELTRPEAAGPGRLFRRPGWSSVTAACLVLAIILTIISPWPRRQERVRVNFITRTFQATIELDGMKLLMPDGTPYITPCTVPDVPTGIHHVVLKRESLKDLDIGRIDFRDRQDIEVRWNSEPDRRTPASVSR
jgi:serine/threonine protein kinase